MKKIAIFGGSFDPIHTDHVNIIKTCKYDLGFDEVWVLPAYVNPFKTVSTSSVTQRLEMIDLAVKNLNYVKVKKFEIRKTVRSYTYDTILHYVTNYPNFDFSFIMGSDQLDNFEKWDHFSDLIKTVKFKVFIRDPEHINNEIIKKYNLETFKFDNNFLSSTKIRNLIDIDLQIKEVNDYINKSLLYLYERLETKMEEDRYFHCLNTGQAALQLAQMNNYDLQKALIAGTLHDITKRWNDEKTIDIIKKYDQSLLKEPKPVWHSFSGAFHLKYEWLFDDEEIINAIFKHTVADKEMSVLDMIVFCADKISIERDYPGIEKIRTLVYRDLKLGFIELLKNQYEASVKKHGKENIGSKLIDSYKYWVKEEVNSE
ncbi:nicotinate-nucleotide adenylyltransferase [Spiroplasma tabanidicola]|uniref:Probable nicotinate-nucleotide adenylyltransferase n=1 Tax=Spiroplasma tabanidicola TaxID=324079 RepID=A0A6I6C7A4_9MOLU|nr:nicotinate-nucleotide adenylyltransferase [Spiroplasma tabanidicola]QGS52090.1 nicotinate-nucleotide adenylyltransferase [Spiroplasma tabanidicola]